MLHLVNLEESPIGGETYHARRSSLCVLLCHLIEAGKANRHNCSSKEEIDECFNPSYHLKHVDDIYRRVGLL